MAATVYASRFLPVLSAGGGHGKTSYNDFSAEMQRRLLLVMDLLQRTEQLFSDRHTPRCVSSCTMPALNLSREGGVYSAAGMTRYGEPYFFTKLAHSGVAYRHGGVEILGAEGRISELELGIFSDDRGFVEGVKARMESGLPDWIATGETRVLRVWGMEDVYAIASRRRTLFK